MKKNAASRDCFCALCRTPRKLNYSRRLNTLHYAQIVLLTMAFVGIFFELFQWKSFLSFFAIWALFEFCHKLLYRKDVKCQTCGFDPTWYRRDVRIARKQVEDHLREKPSPLLLRKRESVQETHL